MLQYSKEHTSLLWTRTRTHAHAHTCTRTHTHMHTHTHTLTHTHPFYSSLDFVRDNLGQLERKQCLQLHSCMPYSFTPARAPEAAANIVTLLVLGNAFKTNQLVHPQREPCCQCKGSYKQNLKMLVSFMPAADTIQLSGPNKCMEHLAQ